MASFSLGEEKYENVSYRNDMISFKSAGKSLFGPEAIFIKLFWSKFYSTNKFKMIAIILKLSNRVVE